MHNYIFRRVSPWEKDLLEKIYRLRFQVYVREREFLSAAMYPDGRERDEFDAQSIHFAAITTAGEVVGSLRLILPGRRQMPIERNILGNRALYQRIVDDDYAEVSRFAISKQFLQDCRRSQLNTVPGTGNSPINKLREVSFGICKSAALHSWNIGIRHWYAFMEKSLWRLLAQNGFTFNAIGEPIEYYGQVTPFTAKVETFHQPIHTYQQRHEICNSIPMPDPIPDVSKELETV